MRIEQRQRGFDPFRLAAGIGRCAAPFSHLFLAGFAGDDFIQHRPFAVAAPQNPAQPLYKLPRRGAAGQDHANRGVRHVHPFVEHVAGDDGGVGPGLEAVENVLPFLDHRLMGQAGNQKPLRYFVGGGVVLGEDHRPGARMVGEDHAERA